MDEYNVKDLFSADKIPYGWAFCFNARCPKSGTCVRFVSSKYLPEGTDIGKGVFPNALSEGGCRHYKLMRTVKLAYGMKGIMSRIRPEDRTRIRQALQIRVGSRSTYYRMDSGKTLIQPELQQAILGILHANGYSEGMRFDGYIESADFQSSVAPEESV